MKDSEQLEQLVANIQNELSPNATITHNVKLQGHKSGRERQIDVLLEDRIGQYHIRIAIECKDYKRPADVKAVESFLGLLDDIKVNKGVLVSPKGFTKAAKTRANERDIDLYSPIDTDPHKWQSKLTIPILCDFRSAAIAIRIETTAPIPFRLPVDFQETLAVFDERENELGYPIGMALSRWNNGAYPIEPGEHDRLPICNHTKIFVDNGYSQKMPVSLTACLNVESKIYFGSLPIARIKGFRDEQTDAIITNAFTTGELKPEEVEQKWKLLSDNEEALAKPVLKITGLVGYYVG